MSPPDGKPAERMKCRRWPFRHAGAGNAGVAMAAPAWDHRQNPRCPMHPYETLPESAFWATAVAPGPDAVRGLWQPKVLIHPAEQIVTFGSCFAQHIGRELFRRGYFWANHEPAPRGLSAQHAKDFNFGVFSARTGNIYTAKMLLQWVRWALLGEAVPEVVWEREGRFYDPFRPAIEPNGFANAEEVRASRQITLEAFATCLRQARHFVFTLGLTESWQDSAGFEYAICPGTVAGEFDAGKHHFLNQDFRFVHQHLAAAFDLMRAQNPDLRVLLTVSPVPLTATASGDHVLVATMRSKSVLRAVAGEMTALPFVDYFPAFEIVTAPVFGGRAYAANQRSVTAEGVAGVMAHFFAGQGVADAVPAADAEDLACEEQLLAVFGKPG
jgi:hypothetical protein